MYTIAKNVDNSIKDVTDMQSRMIAPTASLGDDLLMFRLAQVTARLRNASGLFESGVDNGIIRSRIVSDLSQAGRIIRQIRNRLDEAAKQSSRPGMHLLPDGVAVNRH